MYGSNILGSKGCVGSQDVLMFCKEENLALWPWLEKEEVAKNKDRRVVGGREDQEHQEQDWLAAQQLEIWGWPDLHSCSVLNPVSFHTLPQGLCSGYAGPLLCPWTPMHILSLSLPPDVLSVCSLLSLLLCQMDPVMLPLPDRVWFPWGCESPFSSNIIYQTSPIGAWEQDQSVFLGCHCSPDFQHSGKGSRMGCQCVQDAEVQESS